MIGKDYSRGRSAWSTLSAGEKQYEYDGIIVKPEAVLLNRQQRRLSVVERAISSNPRAPEDIDKLSGRITAWVVANALRHGVPRSVDVSLYLSYPGNTQLEIPACLRATEKRIRQHLRGQSQRRWLTRRTWHVEKVPGSVLAYALLVNVGANGREWRPSHG